MGWALALWWGCVSLTSNFFFFLAGSVKFFFAVDKIRLVRTFFLGSAVEGRIEAIINSASDTFSRIKRPRATAIGHLQSVEL